MAQEAAARAEAAVRESRPKPADPLDRLTQEDLTLAPEQKKELLGRAIHGRAAAMASKAIEAMREENARDRVAMENSIALQTVQSARPELQDPANSSKFAAAMTKVKFEMDAAGATYNAATLMQRAVTEYDNIFRKPGEKPPFIEGSNNPALGGIPSPQMAPEGPSELEQMYDMKQGQIQPGYNPKDIDAINKINNDYVNAKNAALFKGGAVTNVQAILRGGTAS